MYAYKSERVPDAFDEDLRADGRGVVVMLFARVSRFGVAYEVGNTPLVMDEKVKTNTDTVNDIEVMEMILIVAEEMGKEGGQGW